MRPESFRAVTSDFTNRCLLKCLKYRCELVSKEGKKTTESTKQYNKNQNDALEKNSPLKE